LARKKHGIVVWESQGQDGSCYDIYGQHYGSDGNLIGNKLQVNNYTTNYQGNPAISIDQNGNFVVIWAIGGQDGSSFGVYHSQHYDNNGNSIGNLFQVKNYTSNIQQYPATSLDVSGNFAVVWESRGQVGSSYGLYGQCYGSDGNSSVKQVSSE
jgi:hypothetical protein